MIDAFVEGIRSLHQVCHLVIVAPAALVIVAARGRWPAVAGAMGGVALGGFVFATRWIVLNDLQLRLSALLVIAAFTGIGLSHISHISHDVHDSRPVHDSRATGFQRVERFATIGDSPWSVGGFAALVGTIVAQWWRPCVGEELGEILTLAPGDPWGQLLPTVGFMTGIAIPLLAIGLVHTAWPPSPKVGRWLGFAAAGAGIVLALSVVLGQHGEIVARLFRWSQ